MRCGVSVRIMRAEIGNPRTEFKFHPNLFHSFGSNFHKVKDVYISSLTPTQLWFN